MQIVFDERCLEFSAPGHPENPARISEALRVLREQFESAAARPASREELLAVHSREHLERLRHLDFHEPDCPPYSNIYEYAALSAGAAIRAQELSGFSLMRPPGHHAGRDHVAGFCYLNNIAVAVRHSDLQTLIIDIDGHHGDGTQAIFLGDPQVFYLSLHSSPNYPGTGLTSERNCINIPLPFDCGDQGYLQALEEALARLNLSRIEQIAVSAGFDTFMRDPLASLGLSSDCFYEIGTQIARLNRKTFAVLEGGYDAEHLGVNISQFLQGLSEQAGSGS